MAKYCHWPGAYSTRYITTAQDDTQKKHINAGNSVEPALVDTL